MKSKSVSKAVENSQKIILVLKSSVRAGPPLIVKRGG